MRRSYRFLAAMILTSATVSASATNGYFSHGVTAAERAMGGAGVAYANSALSADMNPASLARLADNHSLVLTLFSPDRSYSSVGEPSPLAGDSCGMPCFSIGGGDVALTSERNYFVMPSYGMSHVIDENSAWGFAFVARGGMNTYWQGGSAILEPMGTAELPGTFGAGTARSELRQANLKLSYARRANDRLSLGATLVYIYQTFEVEGIQNFAGFSTDPNNLNDRGAEDSWGLGVQLGLHYQINDALTVGFAYQPEVDMSEFTNYAGLFAEQGDFDYPEHYSLGLNWAIDADRRVLFDIQQINYSKIKALGNPIARLTDGSCMPGMTGGSGAGCLGGSDGAGFGWQDMTIYKLGYQMRVASNLLRLGYSYAEQPIPETEVLFNILAPAVIEQHITLGYDMRDRNGQGVELSFMYAPSNSVSGTNTFDPAQEIELEMSQWELSMAYSY